MAILNSIASWWMRKRMHQIDLFRKYPIEVQEESLQKLIRAAKNTEWGKKHNYESIRNREQFKQNVPIQDYESLKPYIDRIRKGEQNILWNTDIKWFAKSSGTTNDKSKFIPVSLESLDTCHYNGGRDMIAIHCSHHANTKLFTGKNLALSGTLETDQFGKHHSQNGDLSAIVIDNLPTWAEYFRAPNKNTALLSKWDEKVEKMANETSKQNIVSLAGVPSWMLIVLNRVLEVKGKEVIADIWPNIEVYFHGGVNFQPYKSQFEKIIGKPSMSYLELYSASEGLFGIQDQLDSDELLLMLDYNVYYEFMPINNLGEYNSNTLGLDEVQLNTEYALIISTNSGLWRYMLGDTIKFTSRYPFRFKITGRTKHFINAFGEELIVENADTALAIACEKSNAQLKEYTAAPIYMGDKKSGAHEWLIEFEKAPENIIFFSEVFDNALKSINSDYEAKRYQNILLKEPVIKIVPNGTFYAWLSSKNKLGGQHKVPRLSNNRNYIDQIKELIEYDSSTVTEKETEANAS